MRELVHPKERIYFAICAAVSIAIYVGIVGLDPAVGLAVLAGGALVGAVLNGWSLGRIRGNAVRISERQFPEVHRLAREVAARLDLAHLPAIYVFEAGGALNAFAAKFVRRDFVVIYSDVLELAYTEGEDELAFVLAHELAHVKRRHVLWSWVFAPTRWLWPLGQAYSRACEYTCDRMAAHARPAGARRGLLVLAAGKHLYRNVDATEFAAQVEDERGFWVWISELFSTHPHLPKRVRALRQLGALSDAVEQPV